jgi:hypothetical protein
MKKIYSIIAGLLMTASVFAQAPQKMSYQAVIRNASNALVTNQAVDMQVSILQGSPTGTAVYVETQTPTSNANGLVSVEIGGGTVVSGTFAAIDWANGPYFIKTETDPTGGTNYTITNTSQLLSVPYALYAKSAGTLSGSAGIIITSVSSSGDTLFLSNGQTFIAGVAASGAGNLILPTITTNAVTGITSNSATFGGAIINANGNQIAERGIVYSTSPNPTIPDPFMGSNKIVIGNGTGAFDTISGYGYQYPHLLTPNTTYYIRAYAITENNIYAYGNEVIFTTLSVGQAGPAGGIVFFDKGNSNGGWQYLETASINQSSSVEWGCFGTSIPGTQLTVGSGEANTALIIAGCNQANFAAKLCDDLTLGGQTDWFLPSRDELILMYENLHLNNLGNFNDNGYYWSSSEFNNNIAWSTDFLFGNVNNGSTKNYSNAYVRAVRAF